MCAFNIYQTGVRTVLAWLVPHEIAAILAQVLCTPYNHAPCHFMQSHIHKVHAYLAVTCHLHIWQIDWDLLRATAVTQGWNMDTEIRVSTESWLWRRQFCHCSCRDLNPWPFLQGFTHVTFQSWVRHSNPRTILLPLYQQHCVINILSHQGRCVAKWIGHLGCHPFQPHSHWRD